MRNHGGLDITQKGLAHIVVTDELQLCGNALGAITTMMPWQPVNCGEKLVPPSHFGHFGVFSLQ